MRIKTFIAAAVFGLTIASATSVWGAAVSENQETWLFCSEDKDFTDGTESLFAGAYGADETMRASEEDTVQVNGITYQYQPATDSYVVIKGGDQKIVDFPEKINDKPVTAIAPRAFYRNTSIEEVSTANCINMEEIGESAFYGCTKLKRANLTYGKRIEKNAFNGCRNLINIILEHGVHVSSGSFVNCPKLQLMSSLDTLDGDLDAFDSDNKIMIFTEGSVEVFQKFGIAYVAAIDTGELLPDTTKGSIVYFGENLANCKEGASGKIVVEASTEAGGPVKSIGRKAFYGCTGVTEVILPATIRSIETKAFYGCTGLTRVQIPKSVTQISNDAFTNVPGVVFYTSKGSYAEKYAKAHNIACVFEEKELGAAAVPRIKITGNVAVASLPVASAAADGYEIIIGPKDCWKRGNYWQKKATGSGRKVTFPHVRKGWFYSYARAYRFVNGKKEYSAWSDGCKAYVQAITPSTPKISKISVSGSTVTVWLTKSKNSTGYDVYLGKGRDSLRPTDCIYGVKNRTDTKIVFKNVKKGTYYAGVRSSNCTAPNNGRVYSQWSPLRKITIK